MSLARLALRLAATEALLADPVIAAACGKRVFDSEIAKWDARKPGPAITVTTEDDEGSAFSEQNGGEPFNRTCNLVLEIAMWQVNEEEGEPEFVFAPVTNRERESALDLIEHRALEVLTVGESPASRRIRAVVRRFPEVKSSRFPSDEAGVRLAIRVVTLSCVLKVEDQRDVTVTPTGPYARLPDPLRSVCEAMPTDSSGGAVCQMILQALPALDDEPFLGADLAMQPHQTLSPNAAPVREEAGGPPEIDGKADTPWS